MTTTGNKLVRLQCNEKLTITSLSYDGYSSEMKDIQLANTFCDEQKPIDNTKVIKSCKFSLQLLYKYDYNENKKTTIQYCCGNPIIKANKN